MLAPCPANHATVDRALLIVIQAHRTVRAAQLLSRQKEPFLPAQDSCHPSFTLRLPVPPQNATGESADARSPEKRFPAECVPSRLLSRRGCGLGHLTAWTPDEPPGPEWGR